MPSPRRRPATSGCSAAARSPTARSARSPTARSTTSGWSSRSTTCHRCCGTPSWAARCPTCGPGERQRGVQLHLLATPSRRGTSATASARGCASSRATIERAHEDRLVEVIERFDGAPVPDDARAWPPVAQRPPAPPLVAGDDLLRRARRHHLPAHGPAAQPAAGELVRPGALLERRPHRARGAVRTQRRDRGGHGLRRSRNGSHHSRLPRPPAPRHRPVPRPARPVRRHRLPGPVGGPDPAHAAGRVELHHPRRGRRAAVVDVGGAPGAPRRDVHHRHPLRDEVVQARHDVDRRVGRHAARGRRDRGRLPHRLVATATTRPTCRSRTSSTARRGSPTRSRASRWTPSTAARRGCSSRTCTSGRAPSGCAA